MNLSIAIDEQTPRKALMRALAEGTSVDAILRRLLNDDADATARCAEATAATRAVSNETDSGSGPVGCTWSRKEIWLMRRIL